MVIEEIALEMAKMQYALEGLEKENQLLKSHNSYQESLLNLTIQQHDRELLKDVKLHFNKGRMEIKEIEWLIVTLDYYLQGGKKHV